MSPRRQEQEARLYAHIEQMRLRDPTAHSWLLTLLQLLDWAMG